MNIKNIVFRISEDGGWMATIPRRSQYGRNAGRRFDIRNLFRSPVSGLRFGQFLLSVLTYLFWTISIHAQTYLDSTFIGLPVYEIRLIGNEKTDSEFILREIKTRSGDPADWDRIEMDRLRIQSLGLFNRVRVTGSVTRDTLRLQVWLTEKWFLLPFPVMHLNERSWRKVSYGAGLAHANVFGRGEQLSAVIKRGYNPLYQVGYEAPWLGGQKNLSMEVRAWHQRVRSRHFIHEDVTEKHFGLSGILGKRLGHHFSLSGLGRYHEITCPGKEKGLTVRSSGKDRFMDWGVLATWDHRDLREYPTRGALVQCGWIQTSFRETIFHHQRWTLDARGYLPMGGATVALRAMTSQSNGDVPVYHRTYLGYEERIRGHFNTPMEGENRMLASCAWRMPLFPIHYLNMDDAPELRDLKFGISVGLFVDTGLAYMQHENPWVQKWLSGFGAGLHFHLPYADVVRLELAFNEKGNAQWIVDVFVDI